MKYYKGTIHVSAMGTRRLKCALCGKEALGMYLREDKVQICYSCYDEDNEAEFLDI